MTDPSLYRDDSRVRHMLDAMERIAELCKGLEREQLRAMMMRIIYCTRGVRLGGTPRPTRMTWQGRPTDCAVRQKHRAENLSDACPT